jgi:hypothetical protein
MDKSHPNTTALNAWTIVPTVTGFMLLPFYIVLVRGHLHGKFTKILLGGLLTGGVSIGVQYAVRKKNYPLTPLGVVVVIAMAALLFGFSAFVCFSIWGE